MPENVYPVLPNLICMATVVLLPILPAFLLFKLLPKTDGWVGGMFQGLEFKFSGAFAGYLLVLFVVRAYLPPPDLEIWTVQGRVALAGDARSYDDVQIFLSPTDRAVANGSGRLHFWFIRPRNGASPGPLPTVLVEAAGYELAPIDLEDWSDRAHGRSIDVGIVELEPLPDDLPAYGAGLELAQAQGGMP
ncbi:MAG TPA: hypothetical protein VKU40_17155 [Thermoanaerobaculia bacterium]|nr:hypothetical protein [Thermoanaerobaculia bacterium]